MDLSALLENKQLKQKAKTEMLSSWLLENKISIDSLVKFAEELKDPAKATCMEAIEFATKQNPSVITEIGFRFATRSLAAKAPRIKWESAKVIGNTASIFPKMLDEAIKNLLINTGHSGTVVRWSAAFALGEILKLDTKYNKELLPAVETIILREEKNSIKKIYLQVINKLNSQVRGIR